LETMGDMYYMRQVGLRKAELWHYERWNRNK